MDIPGNQRWLFRMDSYRPPEETIRTRDYEVARIPDDATAKAFVKAHHYSGSYPAALQRFGLYRAGALEGVAVFSRPVRDEVLTRVFRGVPIAEGLELGRFVLLDAVPGNGETWFLARCFEEIRRSGIAGVVSFSDPLRREAFDGRIVCVGHVGTIYQAANAVYLGRAKAESIFILRDGTTFPRRTIAKIAHGEQGWRYAVERLVVAGAPPPRCLALGRPDTAELGLWVRAALGVVARKVRHPGNHKYAWAMQRRHRHLIGPPPGRLAYPKMLG